MPLNISKPEVPELANTLQNAFNNAMSLEPTLLAIDDTIENHGGTGVAYPVLLIQLVQAYNGRWWIDKLVKQAIADRTENGRLLAFAWRHGLAVRPPNAVAEVASSSAGLERMLDPGRGFTDVGSLMARLGVLANAICQISYPTAQGTMHGTGFLIGNASVLTNWHVVEHVTPANRTSVSLRFDFRTGVAGDGTVHRLVDDEKQWLIDRAPYNVGDLVSEPIDKRLASARPADHLDYAVVRLAGSPGTEAVGAGGGLRGFLRLPEAAPDPADFHAGAALFVFQHPFDLATKKPMPLQLDWNKPGIRGVTADGTRVLYDVNTRPGASGSPCFNANLELIALHHAGGEDWPAAAPFLYNQGVPIGRVRQLLSDRGRLPEIV